MKNKVLFSFLLIGVLCKANCNSNNFPFLFSSQYCSYFNEVVFFSVEAKHNTDTKNYISQGISCVDGFSMKTYTDKNPDININDVVIEWDFSQVKNIENVTLQIEIQSLDNCWDSLNGTIRSALIKHNIENLKNKTKGNIRVEHLAIKAKCFKWRVIVSESKQLCEKSTPWEFKSFL